MKGDDRRWACDWITEHLTLVDVVQVLVVVVVVVVAMATSGADVVVAVTV